MTAQTLWLIFENIINDNRRVSSGFVRRRRRHYFNIAAGCGNVPTMQRMTLSQRPFGMRSAM